MYRAGKDDVRHRARAGLLQLPARRRDQPRAGQGAVGAARGDAGAPGDDRQRDARRAVAVPRAWRRRTRSSPRARIRCPRRRSTASCSRSSSTIRSRDDELTVIERALADPVAVEQLRLGRGAALSCRLPHARDLRRSGRLALRALDRAGDAQPRRRRPRGSRAATSTYGASPRGPINLVVGARALALLRGRRYVAAAGRPRARQGRAPPPDGAQLRGARRGRRRGSRSSTACSRRSPMPQLDLARQDVA